MRWSLSQLLLVLLLCTGCAYHLKPDYDTRTILVPAEAACSFTQTYRENQNCCVMKPYRSAINVDSALVRAVREYDFRREPRPYDVEGEAYPEIFHGHRYDAQVGKRYELWGVVLPRSDERLGRGVWVGLTLEAAGPKSTDVHPIYCEPLARAMDSQRTWHNAVQSTIKSTLPPAVEGLLQK